MGSSIRVTFPHLMVRLFYMQSVANRNRPGIMISFHLAHVTLLLYFMGSYMSGCASSCLSTHAGKRCLLGVRAQEYTGSVAKTTGKEARGMACYINTKTRIQIPITLMEAESTWWSPVTPSAQETVGP